jgi:hypothetical protein
MILMAINTAYFRTVAATTSVDLIDRLFVATGTGIEGKLSNKCDRERAVMIVTLGTIGGLHHFIVRFMTVKAGGGMVVRIVTLITA